MDAKFSSKSNPAQGKMRLVFLVNNKHRVPMYATSEEEAWATIRFAWGENANIELVEKG